MCVGSGRSTRLARNVAVCRGHGPEWSDGATTADFSKKRPVVLENVTQFRSSPLGLCARCGFIQKAQVVYAERTEVESEMG